MRMPATIPPDMLAICGVNCLACSSHLHAKKPCPGCCAPREAHTRKSCRDCQKKTCATEKGLTHCFLCEDFPCQSVKKMSKRYQKGYGVDLIANGLWAKQDMSAFLADQQTCFTCTCGGIIDQHHRVCSICSTPAP